MLAIANGKTPAQAAPQARRRVTSYIEDFDTLWKDMDWLFCGSGAFTCKGGERPACVVPIRRPVLRAGRSYAEVAISMKTGSKPTGR